MRIHYNGSLKKISSFGILKINKTLVEILYMNRPGCFVECSLGAMPDSRRAIYTHLAKQSEQLAKKGVGRNLFHVGGNRHVSLNYFVSGIRKHTS